ncbi:hypothetical protein ACF3NR_03770 [Vaginella massiliensis]|uniref:hypothetical protein n=1 Tax=Vaginella massiliensis TaxID=1816680 RepID=UPI00375399EA
MKKMLLMMLLSFATMATAQKSEIKLGDFNFLKDQKKVKVVFDYSNLKINADSISEAEYIAKRKDDLNSKNPGNGDAWIDKWKGAKESIWEPKFMELLSKYATKDTGIQFSKYAEDAPYTLTVRVDWIYPGRDAFVMKQYAKVSSTLIFTDSKNKGDKKLIIKYKEAPGDQYGNNFSNESRIGEGFAKTAKTFSKNLEKALKK